MARDQADHASRFFLRSLCIDAYGEILQKSIGPFSPGLNIVYGLNESGKSTTASFIGGVLFGWESARGRKNSYKPTMGERSGSLLFECADDSSIVVSMVRNRNARDVACSIPNNILSDIDKTTFRSTFSFSSDDLRDLGNSDDVAKRLLSAGTGSGSFPMDTSAFLDRRLSACLSKSASCADSIPNLQKRLDDCRERITQASERMDGAARCRDELLRLEESMPELKKSLDEANRQVDHLASCKAELEKLEEDHDSLERFLSRFELEKHSFSREKSRGGFSRRKNTVVSSVAIALFLACFAVGLSLVAVAFAKSSLMLSLLGSLMFLAAACSGIGAVVLKVSALHDDCHQSRNEDRSSSSFAMTDAVGADQKERAIQMAFAQERMEKISQKRSALLESMGIANDDCVSQAFEKMRSSIRQREECQEALERTSLRCGELRQRIDDALGSDDLEVLRQQEQEIVERLRRSKDEFAKMLIARRLMDASLESWSSGGLSRVFQRASRLVSLMTDGRWVKVCQNQEGDLVAFDKWGKPRHPILLSLGTCQQLYLAVRIALLLTADDVGRSIPVISDDILVHFDDRRRRGAARALVELAKKRQVVLFTCHLDIVDLVQEAYADVNVIRL